MFYDIAPKSYYTESLMQCARIQATGSYLPETVIHNEDFSHFPETSKYLIGQKTGVFSRRQAAENESTSDLAVKAAKKCLDKIGFPAEELQGIILSTSSPDRIQPATATRVQHLIEAKNAFAFDINSVCSGSTYGIALADAVIRSGLADNILFVASEVYSRILNERDFSTYPFFGDGAGAIFFQAGSDGAGVRCSVLRTEGGGSEVICVPGGGTMLPFSKMTDPNAAFFKMKGKNVFQFAVTKGAEVIRELSEKAEQKLADIQCFICHQANINIILNISEILDIPLDRFYLNLFRYGNMASASVPVALDEAVTRGEITTDDTIATVAFGGGLSWGANLIRM
jgi:3-oxoacyl-[acyl-carrier-protein] synthase-3